MLNAANVKQLLAQCLDENERMLAAKAISVDVFQERAAMLGTLFNIAQGMTEELIQDCLHNGESGMLFSEYLSVCERVVKAYKGN